MPLCLPVVCVCLSVYSPICLSVFPSVSLCIWISICPIICLPAWLYIYVCATMSVCMCVCATMSVCKSIYVCLSDCLPARLCICMHVYLKSNPSLYPSALLLHLSVFLSKVNSYSWIRLSISLSNLLQAYKQTVRPGIPYRRERLSTVQLTLYSFV